MADHNQNYKSCVSKWTLWANMGHLAHILGISLGIQSNFEWSKAYYFYDDDLTLLYILLWIKVHGRGWSSRISAWKPDYGKEATVYDEILAIIQNQVPWWEHPTHPCLTHHELHEFTGGSPVVDSIFAWKHHTKFGCWVEALLGEPSQTTIADPTSCNIYHVARKGRVYLGRQAEYFFF